MAVKSGQQIPIVSMPATTDTTITQSGTSETREVYLLYAHETAGGVGGTIELFLSDDATGVSAERIDKVAITTDETLILKSIVVGKGKFLLARSTVADINIFGAYTLRNGGDT